MSDSIFDKEKISIPCSNCGRQSAKSVAWIRMNHSFTCTCGTLIKLDTSQFQGELRKADKAISDLERSISKLNFNLKV